MTMRAVQSVAQTNADEIASAWVLQVTEHDSVAISQYEMNHIEESSEFIKIPNAPAWCEHIMLWKNQIVPVMDFMEPRNKDQQSYQSANDSKMLVIVRVFNSTDQSSSYGAIRILQAPVFEKISNKQACQRNQIDEHWSDVSLSAFSDNQSVIPVLDLELLFGRLIER